MNIIQKKLSEIVPYAKNAKKHDKKQIANVAESIKQYGFVQPVVIDRDGVIVIGHCRAEAAKKLGMKTVPCVCVDDLTPEQVNALRLVDNKTNESPWDMDLLVEELPELDLSAFDFDWGIENEDEYGTDFSLPDGNKSEICQMTFTLHEQQKELIEYAMTCVEDEITETFGNANKNGNALYEVIRQWAAQRT
jgi:site-specific DNA-methyltransferase (adenine-specific)